MNKCLNCHKKVFNKFCSVSCQNSYSNAKRANKKFGLKRDFEVVCSNCNKTIITTEREKKFPQKEKYFCSRSCSNRRVHSTETKNKISLSLLSLQRKILKQPIECSVCKKLTFNKKVCSKICQGKLLHLVHPNLASKAGILGGIISATRQNRRSKNEIYFAELCCQKFLDTKTNEPMFNGWDADVIIPSLKVAILWNGPWHYRKITAKHSLEQVQNRDAIKIREIIKAGFIPYIIRDNGKSSKLFVESQFKIFSEAFN